MRRTLSVLGVAGLLLVGVMPNAFAADTITSGYWKNSTLNATPCTHSLCGLFRHDATVLGTQWDITVTLRFEELVTVGCDTPATRTIKESGTVDGKVPFDHDFPCNGTYGVTGSATARTSTGLTDSSGTISRTVAVENPAPVVTDFTVTPSSDGRVMTLVWSDMRPLAVDLGGYTIERKVDDGEYTVIAVLPADNNVFDDTTLPDAEGSATYRIVSFRPNATGDGHVVSASSAEATAPFAPTPTTTQPGGGDGGDGGTGDGGDGDGGDGGTGTTTPGGGTGTTVPGKGTGGGGRKISAPRLGITGTFLPPLLKPSTALTTPTTVDDGYQEELPYDPQEPGGELPEEELAAEFGDESGAGRGMAIPVATGALMAVWAFHLRYLARAARPD